MKAFILFSGILIGHRAGVTARYLEELQGDCAPVHILVARGSAEQEGEGATGRLSTTLKRSIPGATSEAIKYPAKLSPYPQSEAQGVQACKDQMTAYAKRCPQSKLVLMGYSQVCLHVFQSNEYFNANRG
jgi:acetylxylan esterase